MCKIGPNKAKLAPGTVAFHASAIRHTSELMCAIQAAMSVLSDSAALALGMGVVGAILLVPGGILLLHVSEG